MKSVAVIALASGLFTLASAQVYPPITADDVPESTREIWCQQQIAQCTSLCQDQTHADPTDNLCYTEDLNYGCFCKGGVTPNLTEYSQTIPYNICQQSKQACADACGNDQNCATLCFTGKECGASNPRRVNVTSTTTVASSTGSSTSTGTNTADSTTTDGATSTGDPFDNNGMSLPSLNALGSAYGLGAMIAGMAIGFFGML